MMSDTQQTPSGGFGVTEGTQNPSGPPVLPTPGSIPIAQQQTPIVKNNVTASSGGSSGGGGIFGAIGGILGKGVGSLLGGLFNQGGLIGNRPAGFADGGLNADQSYGPDNLLEPPAAPQPQAGQQGQQQQNPIEKALAAGYLIGAYHQQKYGGDPNSLPQATQEISKILEPHMAQGGAINPQSADQSLAQDALNQALGITPDQTQPTSPSTPTNNQPPDQANGLPSQMPSANGSQGFANVINPAMQNMVNAPTNRPQGYAAGGIGGPGANPPPGMGNQNPLQPGQPFQGDGSVKGPGGPTDDAIPAKLSNGEFVMSSAATQYFGVDKLNQMNEKGKQGFMQALHQVDQNQQAPPAAPGQPPTAPQPPPGGAGMMQKPPMPQPMMQKAGGPAMRPKASGYMGI